MPIPAGITAQHVREAFRTVKAEGVPAGAQSTKYAVIDPDDGSAYPPKLITAIAAKFATGKPLSRQDFSGGQMTNTRLRALGFEIVTKRDNVGEPLTLDNLRSGTVITNDQVCEIFGVGNSGGMRWSKKMQSLVIIADHTKGLYDDQWFDSELHYTGMGRIGDQNLVGQNKRLADQKFTNICVHLFEVFEFNSYHYAGRVGLVSDAYEARQLDAVGNDRRVYIFPLQLLDENAGPPAPTAQQLKRISAQREKTLHQKSTAELVRLARKVSPHVGRRPVFSQSFIRNEAVSVLVKRLAKGICDLCETPAPFTSADGPFLECHHVHHLSRGGADAVENAVALCPNCHRRMHVLDHSKDVQKLQRRVTIRNALLPTSSGG